jgi:hypothetical protein
MIDLFDMISDQPKWSIPRDADYHACISTTELDLQRNTVKSFDNGWRIQERYVCVLLHCELPIFFQSTSISKRC